MIWVFLQAQFHSDIIDPILANEEGLIKVWGGKRKSFTRKNSHPIAGFGFKNGKSLSHITVQ